MSLEPLDIPPGQDTPPITPTFAAPLPMGSIMQTDEYASFHQPPKEAADEARTAQQRASMRKSVSFRHKDQPTALADQQPLQELQAQQASSHPSRAATPHPSKLQQRPSRTSLAQPPPPSACQPDGDQVSIPAPARLLRTPQPYIVQRASLIT